ncbi:hypothetical protein FKW77_004756 [Venturia effusa]|uniref:Uncharacterized protein n=1 Tax=Venturia effusa TaxID=50376 RepID=A0A517LDM0_9PEZI|nr:hypothetical protein FKW77_004756 [Venturia effusa]
MGGIWQSLKQRLSRRHPDRTSKNVDPKPAPNDRESEMGNEDWAEQPELNHSTRLNETDQQEHHGPGAECELVDEVKNFQPGQQANDFAVPRTSSPESKKPLSEEQQALLDDLRVDYEDEEDDSPPEEVMVVESADYDSRVEIQPVLYESENRLDNPASDSGLILGRPTNATTYKMSFPLPSAISASPPDVNSVGVANLEAGSDSAKRSYLSIIPSTIQVVTENVTLFVWHANFHPAIGRRFSSVRVACKFSSAPSTPGVAQNHVTSSGVEIKAFAPHKSYGASSREQRKITWGLELPLTVPAGPVSVGVTPSAGRETSKEVEHAFTIEGSARGTPLRNNCVWTVQENASTERGIPSELQLAAMVKHNGRVQFDVDIEGTTAGGYLLNHHLKPKMDAMGRRKIIDPVKYAGLLHEFEFGDRGQLGCAKLLEKWTGQVQGAVLEFDQPVMRA